MPVGPDTQIPLSVINPLDAQAKGFALGQAQLGAQRETAAYNQQQSQQKALKDIFANADMSTPEGQADALRQIYKVDPKTAMALQQQQQEQKLKQSEIERNKATGQHAAAETEKIQFDQFQKFRNDATTAAQSILGTALEETKGVPANFSGYQDSIKKANASIDAWSRNMRNEYGDNPRVNALLDQIDKHDFKNTQEMQQFLQTVGMSQQVAQKGVMTQQQMDQKVELARRTTAAREGEKNAAEGLNEKERALNAAMTYAGVPIPAGFRTPRMIKQGLQSLLEAHPDMTPEQIAQGVKGGKLTFTAEGKEAQVAGTQVGKVLLSGKELPRFANLAEDAIKKVPRTTWLPVNKLIEMRDSQIQDPNQRQLKVYTNEILNAYEQLGSRSGVDVHKREELRSTLLSADSPGTYKAALDAMRKSVVQAEAAGKEVIADVSGKKQETKQSAPAAAIEHLKGHPELKDAFKAKYGYLPDGI